jgi:hypothetical protein
MLFQGSVWKFEFKLSWVAFLHVKNYAEEENDWLEGGGGAGEVQRKIVSRGAAYCATMSLKRVKNSLSPLSLYLSSLSLYLAPLYLSLFLCRCLDKRISLKTAIYIHESYSVT